MIGTRNFNVAKAFCASIMKPLHSHNMIPEAADQRLVSLAQAGDIDAFDLLVLRHRSRVLKVIQRFVRNRADAEDAVQEAFIKAYLNLPRFRGDCAFYTWLHQIAVNCAKTTWFAQARNADIFVAGKGADDNSTAVSAQLSNAETPEDLLLADEMTVAVNSAIDRLSEEHRTAIWLRDLEGLSYSQMALAMACPIGTVRSRVSRARDAIDGQLREVFVDAVTV